MWDKIWEGIRVAMLTFFGPPDVDDEVALRKWMDKMLGLLRFIAARTRTDADDRAVAGLQDIVDSPARWAVVYRLIIKMFGDGVIGPALGIGALNGAAIEARSDVKEAADEIGLPIGLFVQILLMLLKLLRK